MSPTASTSARVGFMAALGAYTLWGVSPLFWALLKHVDSFEVLAHRILWSAVLAWGIFLLKERGLGAVRTLREPRALLSAIVSTALIAINWFVYLWAVTHERVTEVSIGYYLNPLINILLGRLVLGERLSSLQALAVVFAASGVTYLTWSFGALPWVSMSLAISFGIYGLVRKQASMPALAGLAVETGLCAPFCAAYLLILNPSLGVARTGSSGDMALLLASGVFTATPLLLFALGARRLQYSTMGMLQYLAPTLQLGCAILVFGEPFAPTHAVTFFLIWGGVCVYALDALIRRRTALGIRTTDLRNPSRSLIREFGDDPGRPS